MMDIREMERMIEHGEIEEVQRRLRMDKPIDGSRDEASHLLIGGLIHYRTGNYRDAIANLSLAMEIAKVSGDRKLQSTIANHHIWIGLKAGQHKTIRNLFRTVERVAGKRLRRIQAFHFINHAYAISLDIGFIESARFSEKLIHNAFEGLKQAERLIGKNEPALSVRSALVRGLLYQQQDQWDDAVKEMEESLWETERERLPFLKADLLEELGNLHFRFAEELRGNDPGTAKEKYKDAGKAFEEALEIWRGINRDQEGVLSSALGDVWYRMEDYQRSWEYHSLSREIFGELDYPHGVGLQLDALGKVALKMGLVKDGIANLKKALKVFKKLDVRHEALLTQVHLVDGYFLLSRNKGKKELQRLLNNEPVKRYRDCYRELKEVVNREDWLREDPDLSELFLKPLPRFITLELMEQIIQAAKRAHPNEMGALLHGDPVLDRLEFVLDSAKGTDTFMFSLYNRYSGDYMYSDGSVHSHPSGAAVPSKADLSFFGKFPSVNIIIAYPYALDSWAAYDRNGNRVKLSVIYRQDKENVEAQLEKLNSTGTSKKADPTG